MSKSIDGGTVKVNFDNREFNSAVDESTHKINSFKDAIVSLPSDIGNGLSNILSRFNLSDVLGIAATLSGIGLIKEGIQGISGVIESVASSAAQIVDSAFDKVYNGGMERALNIEQAKFQLKGLGLDIDTFMEAANFAVEGTAYGLDSAAKAAAQLGASGVTELEALKQALRGISGVASMTNSTYDEMAYVFTSVAGTGRVMARQLDSIAFRGLNARAALAKYLGKTEEEIRKMTSDGAIDFATFAAAMDDAFGEHAKDANETFSGSLDNIEAALRRIGEAFWTPVITNSVDLFNAIRIALVNFKQELVDNEVYNKFTAAAGTVIQRLKDMVKWIDTGLQESDLMKTLSAFAGDIFNTIVDISKITVGSKFMGWTKQILNNVAILVGKVNDLYLAFQNAFNAVYGISKYGVFENLIRDASDLLQKLEKFNMYDLEPTFKSWFETLHEVFSVFKDILGINKESIADSFEKAVKAAFEFFKKLKISDEELVKLKNIAQGFASAIDIVFMLVKAIFGFVKPIGSEIRPVADDILSIGEGIANWVTDLRNSIKEGDVFVKFFEKVSAVVAKVKEIFEGVKVNFFDAFFGDKEGDKDKTFIDRVVTFVKGIIETVKDAFGLISSGDKKLDFSPIQDLINNLANYGFKGSNDISKIDSFLETVKNIFGDIALAFEWIGDKTNKIKEPLDSIAGWLGDLIENALEHIGNIIEAFNAFVTSKVADGSIDKEVILFVTAKVSEIILSIISLFDKIRRSMERMPNKIASAGLLFTIAKGLSTIFSILKSIKDNPLVKGSVYKDIIDPVLTKIGDLEKGLVDLRQGKETFSKVVKALTWFIVGIAASLFIVSLIPADDLKRSFSYLTGMMLILAVIAGLIALFSTKFQVVTSSVAKIKDADKSKYTERVSGTLTEFSKAIKRMAMSLIMISASLWIATKAVQNLGDNPERIGGIFAILFALFAVCVGALIGFAFLDTKILQDFKAENYLIIASSVAVMCLSLVLIASAVKTLAEVGNSNKRLRIAAGIITLIFAIVSIIIGAIGFIVSKNPQAIEGMIAGSVAIFLALIALTYVIKAFSKAMEAAKGLNPETIWALAGGISVILIVVGLIVAAIGALSSIGNAGLPAILALDLALLLIAAIIAAMALLVVSLKDLFTVLFKLFEYDESDVKRALLIFTELLLGLAGILDSGLPAIIMAVLKSFVKVLPAIEAFFTNYLIPSIVRVIANSAISIGGELVKVLAKVLLTLATFSPEFKEAAKNLITEFVFGASEEKEGAIDIILGWISELVDRIHNYINDNLDGWITNLFETFMTLLTSVADKLEKNQDEITEKLTTIIRSLILILCNTISGVETDEEVRNAAHDAIQSLINGVEEMFGQFGNAMKELAINGVQNFLEGLDGFSIWDAITGAFSKEDLDDSLDVTPVIQGNKLGDRRLKNKFNFSDGLNFGGSGITEALKNAGKSVEGTSINMDELSEAITNGVISGMKDSNKGNAKLPGAVLSLKFNGYETNKVLKGTALEQSLGGYGE